MGCEVLPAELDSEEVDGVDDDVADDDEIDVVVVFLL